ncbi:MAG: outer membrane lipoprotein carrier protein LolA [Bacteroidetes bacterium]|nr:outer membrane lipoprotein carrier protein LolA [Bacteroidota bacterium]
MLLSKLIHNKQTRNFFIPITFCLSISSIFAQDQDPKAKQILDDLSKITKSYKTITSDYSLVLMNKEGKVVEKQIGKVQIKGEKFKLDIPGNTIVCDGKTIWNYNKDAKELTIKNFDASNEDQLNPSKLFTIYEKGYKFKFDKEEKLGGTQCSIIDLYPAIKPEKKKFHTIKLYVDKIKKQIAQMKLLMKDGTKQVYEIKMFKTNSEIQDALFTYDAKSLKPDQINDERD